MRQADGTLAARDRGTPQGSAVSPVLANLYLHYAFDMWLAREHPGVAFERYCDDAVIHCSSQEQAVMVRDALAARLAEVGLELHPDKTRVVYCKDADRRGDHEVTSFTFLGYTFRPRLAKNRRGKHFVSFLPAVSKDAVKAMSREIRSWHIARRNDKSLTDLAQMFNSIVQGWINYYGRFYKSMLYPLLRRINDHLVRWERPHPGAQLRFTDINGCRFTAFATGAKTGNWLTWNYGTAAGHGAKTGSATRRTPGSAACRCTASRRTSCGASWQRWPANCWPGQRCSPSRAPPAPGNPNGCGCACSPPRGGSSAAAAGCGCASPRPGPGPPS